MTFSSLTDYLMEHPAFQEAVDSYNNGDTRLLKNIMMDVQMHSYQQTALLASKVYGLNKWQNSADIKSLIRETPPPTLDFTLPIPKEMPRIGKITKAKARLKIMIHNQLSLFQFLQIA